MIKIGCAAYSYRIYFESGTMGYEEFIEEAHNIGLDGVELTLYWLPSEETDYLRNLRRLALFHGLPISCAGISTDFCNPNPLERSRMIMEVKKGLKIAKELGAPVLRIFGGNLPEGFTEVKAMGWTIGALKECVNYAKEVGVVIAIENHGGITARADSLISLVREVDSPWLAVNLDLGNYRESTYEDIAKTIHYTVHIHGKLRVAGGGDVDYEKVKRLLKDAGYNGFISIEYEEEGDPKTGVREFATYLMNLFR
ncbi:MAG: sugar phosphate isomerase/epimerase family protein [Candidatus Bathyarchaeia archaeon]